MHLVARRAWPWGLVVAALLAAVATPTIAPAATLHGPSRGGLGTVSNDDWLTFHADDTHSGVSTDPADGAVAATAGLTQKWATALGNKVFSSPAVAYNGRLNKVLVYAETFSNRLVAVDAETGAIVWSYKQPAPNSAYSSPAVYQNTVYVGSMGNHSLFAVNAATGKLQCSFQTPGRVMAPPIVADLGNGPVVFFGDAGLTEDHNYGSEWAITGVGNSAGPCQLLWRFTNWGNTDGSTYPGSWSPPALGRDAGGRPVLVFGSTQPDDAVYGVNASDGSLIWRFATATGADLDVGAGAAITPPGVNGFPDGEVYIDGKTQYLYALDLATGALNWSFKMRKAIPFGTTGVNNAVSTPAVVGNAVYLGFAYGVEAINATTGAPIWYSGTASPTTALVLSSPAVAGASGDQAIYSTDTGGAITAYRLADGVQLWQYTTSQPLDSSPAVSDGKVYFGGFDGNLYAFAP